MGVGPNQDLPNCPLSLLGSIRTPSASGPSLGRGGEDPEPFRKASGVLFSKKPMFTELQVTGMGQQAPQLLIELRV